MRLLTMRPHGGSSLRRVSGLVPAVALVGGLLLTSSGAAAAGPVTPLFTIAADNAAAVPAGHLWAFNDFFPRSATIAQGGTFQFVNGGGFHTATLLPLSWTAPVRTADMDVNGIVAADLDDTSANPNGTTHVLENLAGLMPVQPSKDCGTADAPCVFDGTAIVGMGAPLDPGPPAPFFVTVTAPVGKYIFHCRVHPGMSGTLTVVAAGASGTTTAASAAADAVAQTAADVTAGTTAEAAVSKAAVKTNANGSHTYTLTVGASDPTGHVEILEMLPRSIKVHPGDAVVWRTTAVNEPHTVTFPGDIHTDSPVLCEGAGGKDTPAKPTVVPPASPFDFACNGHPADEVEFGGGNGVKVVTSPTTVSDSGLIALPSETIAFDVPVTGALQSWAVRFTNAKPGTYHYVCQIHQGMEGTIVVH
jgi:plastocyanin